MSMQDQQTSVAGTIRDVRVWMVAFSTDQDNLKLFNEVRGSKADIKAFVGECTRALKEADPAKQNANLLKRLADAGVTSTDHYFLVNGSDVVDVGQRVVAVPAQERIMNVKHQGKAKRVRKPSDPVVTPTI